MNGELSMSKLPHWQQITADMMSDKEREGDSFVRHCPSYPSYALNKFLDKLDNRFNKKSTQQPRMARQLGSPVDKEISTHARSWMIKPELRRRQEQGDEEPHSNQEILTDECITEESESKTY